MHQFYIKAHFNPSAVTAENQVPYFGIKWGTDKGNCTTLRYFFFWITPKYFDTAVFQTYQLLITLPLVDLDLVPMQKSCPFGCLTREAICCQCFLVATEVATVVTTRIGHPDLTS